MMTDWHQSKVNKGAIQNHHEFDGETLAIFERGDCKAGWCLETG